jgi:hypothetical protein
LKNKTKGRRVRNHLANFEKLLTTTHDHFSALYTEGHVAYFLVVEQMLENIEKLITKEEN